MGIVSIHHEPLLTIINPFPRRILFTLIFMIVPLGMFAQPRSSKTNWLQEKNEQTARWRMGFGANVGEPIGFHLFAYRLHRICKQDFSITKRVSVAASIGREGYIFPGSIESRNAGWGSGGIRYGLDLKVYIPFYLNPYIGVGVERGGVGTTVLWIPKPIWPGGSGLR